MIEQHEFCPGPARRKPLRAFVACVRLALPSYSSMLVKAGRACRASWLICVPNANVAFDGVIAVLMWFHLTCPSDIALLRVNLARAARKCSLHQPAVARPLSSTFSLCAQTREEAAEMPNIGLHFGLAGTGTNPHRHSRECPMTRLRGGNRQGATAWAGITDSLPPAALLSAFRCPAFLPVPVYPVAC